MMEDVGASAAGWEKLGEHQGNISSLVWSPDGECLFSASYDGEIRKWSNSQYETVRPGVNPPGEDDAYLYDLTWSSSQNELIASVGGDLAVYRNGRPEPALFSNGAHAVSLRSDPTGGYLASREVAYITERGQHQILLRIRSSRSLDDPPRLDSDDVFARGSWHFGLAWHPQKPLLAVLAEHRISFALPLDGRLMNNSWVVKSFANDIAWISDDELAVAFDDANIRIYSWDENNPSSFSSSLNRKLAKTKVVLEAHQNSVYSIASGLDHKIFVTVDIADRLHVWSANGNHLGEFLVPANERTSQPALLAIHPARPIIALSRYNVLYKKALDIFPDTIAASQVEPEKKAETLLSRLLRRGGLSPPEILTSDDASARCWGVTVHLETDSERVARTLQLRHIGKLIGQLSVNAGDAMRLLWKDLSHDETIAFEDLDLAESDLSGGHPETVRIRKGLRDVLISILASKNDIKRNSALCAYTALGYLERPGSMTLLESSAYVSALDQLKDDNLRLKLKRSRSRASLKKIEKISALLEGVHAALVNMLERLESERDNRRAAAEGDLAMNKPREVHDVIVMAALQELEAVRRYLDELGFSREEGDLGNRMIETFQLSTSRRGSVLVGLMLALAKGKTETKSLLEAIKVHSRVQHVVMVGMMAGIKGKSKLLDVLAPLTIYDVTSIGTKEGKFLVEPEAGTMDPKMHNWAAGIDPKSFRDPPIRLISHKKTVTFSAKVDDITHDLAKAALNVDCENVVGLEMEGSALSEMQTRHFGNKSTGYLMIKGIADYAGARPAADEIEELSEVPDLKEHLSDPDPTNSDKLKGALQREATRRALRVALELLRKLPAS